MSMSGKCAWIFKSIKCCFVPVQTLLVFSILNDYARSIEIMHLGRLLWCQLSLEKEFQKERNVGMVETPGVYGAVAIVKYNIIHALITNNLNMDRGTH